MVPFGIQHHLPYLHLMFYTLRSILSHFTTSKELLYLEKFVTGIWDSRVLPVGTEQ